MASVANPPGGYRYAPGISPYSAGVRADDDHEIVRITVTDRVPWNDGFSMIDEILASGGRPPQALCAIELRCPAVHSFGGFGSFNDEYRSRLDERGILLAGGVNPVARTNVAPAMPGLEPGSETELHAFSFTRQRKPTADGRPAAIEPSFVVAGAGDLRDQSELRPEAIVGGDSPWSQSGPQRAAAVLDEIEARLRTLGVGWEATDEIVLYSVEDIGDVVASTVLPRLGPAGRGGVRWLHARPPIEGLRFEMDTRGGVIERRA